MLETHATPEEPMSKSNGAAPNARWQFITPAEAEKLLESQLNNRRLSQRRINSYAEDMAAGRWVENGESVKISDKGNLIDGQHRLSAIVKTGKPIRTLVVTGLPEKTMTTVDQGKSRTNSDVLGLIGANNSTHAAGITRALWEIEKFGVLGAKVYPPRAEIVKMYKANADEIQEGLVAVHAARKVLRNRVSAAIAYILISRKAKRKAGEFFAAISERDGAPAVKALTRFVDNNAHRIYAEKFVPIILKAWNAWVTGDDIKVLGFRLGEAFPDVETGR